MKNRSNEIRSNEIRIRQELPVDIFVVILTALPSEKWLEKIQAMTHKGYRTCSIKVRFAIESAL